VVVKSEEKREKKRVEKCAENQVVVKNAERRAKREKESLENKKESFSRFFTASKLFDSTAEKQLFNWINCSI